MTRARDLSFLSNVITAGTNVVVGGGMSVSGIVTANKFIGDGSGLTNVIGSGSGVVIRNNGSLVGTAASINFGIGLTVTPLSVGIVTVNTTYAPVSGISTVSQGLTETPSITVATIAASSLNSSGIVTG